MKSPKRDEIIRQEQSLEIDREPNKIACLLLIFCVLEKKKNGRLGMIRRVVPLPTLSSIHVFFYFFLMSRRVSGIVSLAKLGHQARSHLSNHLRNLTSSR